MEFAVSAIPEFGHASLCIVAETFARFAFEQQETDVSYVMGCFESDAAGAKLFRETDSLHFNSNRAIFSCELFLDGIYIAVSCDNSAVECESCTQTADASEF